MKERLFDIAVAATLPLVAATALSEAQRRAIRQRDRHCRFPHPEGEVCREPHYVHHIKPQRWLKDRNVPEELRDVPENLIYVCHVANNRIHPNMVPLYEDGAPSQLKHRDSLIKEGQRYWNSLYDKAMWRIAGARTKEARKEGWVYPPKPKNPPTQR